MESNHRLQVRGLLIEWARWRYYSSGEVKGYPHEVPFYRLFRGASVGGPVITDEMAEKVDRAVSRLTERCPDQGQVLTLYYLDFLGLPKIGKRCGMCESKARQLLTQAEHAIEWIVDSN